MDREKEKQINLADKKSVNFGFAFLRMNGEEDLRGFRKCPLIDNQIIQFNSGSEINWHSLG